MNLMRIDQNLQAREMRWAIQYCDQYDQKEDYYFVTHGNEEKVMRQNSNAFSLLEEGY